MVLVYFWFFFILWFKLDYIQLYKGESINEAGRHRRLNTIEIVDLNTLNLEISKTSYADRLFGTSCVLNSEKNSIYVIFGRSSPNKVYEMVSLMSVKSDEGVEFSANTFEMTNNTPLSRWRHGSCKLKDERIVVFGGKSFNAELNKIVTLCDMHIFSKNDNNWSKVLVCFYF